MENSTKEAWTEKSKNLSPEGKEKRKLINKKIFKFGCLPILGLFFIVFLIGVFSGSDDTTTTTDKQKTTQQIDSTEIKENQRIQDSIAQVKAQAKLEAEKTLKTFKSNNDEFNNTSFYRDPRTPNYTNVNFIYPYIGKDENNNYWLRLKFQYTAEDWLFIQSGVILVDDEKFTISGTWERDNNSTIWEWLDMPVGESELMILEKIANSKSAKIRYIGSQYHNDRTITSKEKSIIKKTLDVYNELK